MPNMIPVSSSNLSAVGYDGQTMQLFIRFHSGALYVYNSVPQSIYEGLMNASSHGQYLAAHIKNVYPYRRLS